MFRSFFFHKDYRFFAWSVLSFLLAILVFQVFYVDIAFNTWFRDFYDLLQKSDQMEQVKGEAAFWSSMLEFGRLAFLYIFVASIASFIARYYTFRWREAITLSYLPLWQALEKEKYEGSSQRVQEDTMRFAAITHSLGLGAVRAVFTLFAFTPILWTLSKQVPILHFGVIEGSLVYVAILMSIGGILVSLWVGRKLPGLEYNNQKVEAAFRKQLVYGEDLKEYLNFNTFIGLFTGLRYNYHRLFRNYFYFSLWENLYYQTAIIIPYIAVGPSLFLGTAGITLGVLTQTAQAFGSVQKSLSYLIDNWVTVNELRSIHKRLKEFEAAIGFDKLENHQMPNKPKEFKLWEL